MRFLKGFYSVKKIIKICLSFSSYFLVILIRIPLLAITLIHQYWHHISAFDQLPGISTFQWEQSYTAALEVNRHLVAILKNSERKNYRYRRPHTNRPFAADTSRGKKNVIRERERFTGCRQREEINILYYYLFKIFLCFWLAKITRIIHHKQLLLTKFRRILR